MLLHNRFTVPLPVEEAWPILLDVEQIAPCVPGATLEGTEGNTFFGRVQLKLGPMKFVYQGEAEIVDRDDDLLRAVFEARAKEAGGAGKATARVTMSLNQADMATLVDVETHLDITGKAAQFGGGVLESVGGRLFDDFARNLSQRLVSGRDVDAVDITISPDDHSEIDKRPDAINVLAVASLPPVIRAATAVVCLLVVAVAYGRRASSRTRSPKPTSRERCNR
jgi:uncharacterized protein